MSSARVVGVTHRRITLKVHHSLALGPDGLSFATRFRERLVEQTAQQPLPISSGEVGAQRRVRDIVKENLMAGA